MSEDAKVEIACIVLTLNEECNLPATLTSLSAASQIIVVDCGSTDQTVALAARAGAEVLDHPWPGYAEQRNWALEHPAVRHDWVLFVDADEQMSAEGWGEVAEFLRNPGPFRAADFRRSVVLFGRELKHGGFGSARVTRLLHRHYCRFLGRPVHEHAIVDGKIHHLRQPLIHHDRKSFSAWLDRHNRYSTLEAQARFSPPIGGEIGSMRSAKQSIRTHVWPRLPARPLLFFLYVYVVRLGILDGRAGFRIAAFYAFQELAVQVKLEELMAERRR